MSNETPLTERLLPSTIAMAEEGSIGSDVKKFESSINKLKRMAERFGTKADSKENRAQLEKERDAAKQLAQKLTAALKAAPRTEVRAHAKPVQALLKELQTVNERLDATEKAVVRKAEASMSNKPTSPLANADAPEAQPQASQAQAQDGDVVDANKIEFLEYDINELEQRRAEIAAIERDVRDVAEMFRDVATMVNQQQEGVDKMGENIQSAKTHAESGAADVVEAERLQNAARKKQCCILIIVLCILGVILGPVLGTQLKKS